jgi:exopolyphosphatase/guanosine-5'-triphosphate,3'-diphosphate pyrophosphatase
VRLHKEFAGNAVDLPARAAKKLRKRARKGIAAVRKAVRQRAPERCIATGGTVRALAHVLLASSPQAEDASLLGAELPAPALAELAERLQRASHAERLAMPGMSPRRADLLPAGAAILASVLGELGFQSLTLCDWGLREGIMLDAVRTPELDALRSEEKDV